MTTDPTPTTPPVISLPFTLLEIRMPKTSEKNPEPAAQLFAAFSSLPSLSTFDRLRQKTPVSATFEIAVIDQTIRYFVICPLEMRSYVESQIAAHYPEALVSAQTKDYLTLKATDQPLTIKNLVLAKPYYLPLKTFRELKDVDSLAAAVGALSKAGPTDFLAIQILIAAGGSWQTYANNIAKGIPDAEGKSKAHPLAKEITVKTSVSGYWTGIRLIGNTAEGLKTLNSSFAAFTSDTNSLKKEKRLFPKSFLKPTLARAFTSVPKNQILNVDELASLWHPPSLTLAGIKNIAWCSNVMSEPPRNLPVVDNLTEEEKKDINWIGRTEFKNKVTSFGIKRGDRRRHIYLIGKSGTGKSTFLYNMAINDIRNGEGIGVVDPHGDTVDILLDYIPSYRVNDVCILDPSDTDHPFYLNPLEITDPAQKELVASNIVAIFYKLYGNSWGPRLEYILRNTLLTLLETPEPTLPQIVEMLTNPTFRKKVYGYLKDPILKNYWLNEFEVLADKDKAEQTASILNKIGQFVASPVIRPIISHYKSTISIEEIMNSGKILLVNLSQGRIGEDNAALLGAMIITTIQLAAMNRVRIPEKDRKDFFLYVDEFQNFATTSFAKILSEARKYRLSMFLANQYIGQLDEEVSKAIFGNAGTVVTFVLGAADAKVMASEFGQIYTEKDLVSLGMFQIALKLCVDNITSNPFLATTFPPPNCKNQNRAKILRVSREKYTKAKSPEVNS